MSNEISTDEYLKLSSYIIKGDVYSAIELMKTIPGFEDTAKRYTDIFEDEHYIRYDIPDELNDILTEYQRYLREVLYLREDESEAERKLYEGLGNTLAMKDHGIEALEKEMQKRFERHGYKILCGKTNGYHGPYVWRETVPVTYDVELPESVCKYKVNILRGFVFRAWMDYITFGEKGTGGWASPDGTINCVEKAYDFESERFKVSLLKHEAQHVEDMKRWHEIEQWELEYRAKLVELIYTKNTNLLEKFASEADERLANNAHAVASSRIIREFGKIADGDIAEIRKRATELFGESTKEMDRKYL